MEVKKISLKLEIDWSKNAEYDWAWVADHEKEYFIHWKNQFLRSKFLGQNVRRKKCL